MNLVADMIFEGYRLIQPIGNNLRVWQALQDRAALECAIKFEPDPKKAGREIRVLRSLVDNPHAPTLIDSFSTPHGTAIVSHMVPGERLDLQFLSKTERLQILCDAADFIGDLADIGSFHGDLKESNILWDGANSFFLDFGYSFDEGKGGTCSWESVTPEHSPDHGDVGTPSDVMAWGRLLQCLRPDLLPQFRDCFESNPEDRPTPGELIHRLEASGKRRRLWKQASMLMLVAAVVAIVIVGLRGAPSGPARPMQFVTVTDLGRPMAIFKFEEPTILYGDELVFLGDSISGKVNEQSATGRITAIGINAMTISRGVEVMTIPFPKPVVLREYNMPYPVVIYGQRGNMNQVLRAVATLAGLIYRPTAEDGAISGVFVATTARDLIGQISDDLGCSIHGNSIVWDEKEFRIAFGIPAFRIVFGWKTSQILAKFEPVLGDIKIIGEDREWPTHCESGWQTTLDALNLKPTRTQNGVEIKNAQDF